MCPCVKKKENVHVLPPYMQICLLFSTFRLFFLFLRCLKTLIRIDWNSLTCCNTCTATIEFFLTWRLKKNRKKIELICNKFFDFWTSNYIVKNKLFVIFQDLLMFFFVHFDFNCYFIICKQIDRLMMKFCFFRMSSFTSDFFLLFLSLFKLNAIVLDWINSISNKKIWFNIYDKKRQWQNSFCIIELYLFVSRINSKTKLNRFLIEVNLIFVTNNSRLTIRKNQIWICWKIFICRRSDWINV